MAEQSDAEEGLEQSRCRTEGWDDRGDEATGACRPRRDDAGVATLLQGDVGAVAMRTAGMKRPAPAGRGATTQE
jgi:hypothetical protein